MAHLDKARVRSEFKGMIERCADCGFDLAEGLVEVVPTAHYMMGGVEFAADCATALAGLYAAGEDTGGVHGANRLGGNGVANSTVFGAIAGDSMAARVHGQGAYPDPDEDAIEAAAALCRAPLGRAPGDLEGIRERLLDVMWEDCGIVRDAEGLERAASALASLEDELDETGVAGDDPTYNMTWHDWLNLKSQILIGRAITAAAARRRDSRGAHYRSDFPETGELARSSYTRVRLEDGVLALDTRPVEFTRVAPGHSLIA